MLQKLATNPNSNRRFLEILDGNFGELVTGNVVDARQFGVVADGVTDCTAAIQAAINSFTSAGTLVLPFGVIKISAAILIATLPIIVKGSGVGGTYVLQVNPTADAFTFHYSTFVMGGGVCDLSIHAGSLFFTGTGSTGRAISVQKANGGFKVHRFDIEGFATGIRVAQSFYPEFVSGQVLYSQDYGILADTPAGGSPSAGLIFSRLKVSNFGFTGNNANSIGVGIKQSGGDFWGVVDITSHNRSVEVKPAGGDVVNYLFMHQVLADTPANDGWVFDSSSGSITANELSDCWAGFATNGSGVRLIGPSIDGLRFNGGRFRENGKHGFSVEGAVKNVSISDAEIASNSKLTALTYHGIDVSASVLSLSVNDSRIGNYASVLTQQMHGISVAIGFAGLLKVDNCDLRNPGTGGAGLANFSSAYIYASNNWPAQLGYAPHGVPLNMNSGGTVAAGATVYLGCNGAKAAELDTVIVATEPGVINQLRMQVELAPGVGQTFTYTVMLNNVATTLIASISGAGVFSVVSFGNVTYNTGDIISTRLVTSAGAAVTRHRGSLGISR